MQSSPSNSLVLFPSTLAPGGTRNVVRLAFAAALACVAGCSAPEADPLGTSRQELFANDKTAYDYFIGKGLTNIQAAGVVGNLDQESGVDPAIHQAGGGVGRGIAQWSAGARWDTTDKDNVVAYAAQQGQSATSLGLQLDFMWYELTTFPAYGLADLKASTNITLATTAVEDKFEGCVYANYPECALPSRINFANGIFKAYGANTGQGGGGANAGGASAGGSSGSGGASAGGSSGSGGANTGGAGGSNSAGAGVGGSSGSSSAGTSGSSSGMAGSTSASGGSGIAGSTSASGGSGTAGSSSAAGGPSIAGSANVAGNTGTAGSGNFTGLSGTSTDPGCGFSPPRRARSGTNGALSLLGALLASTWVFRRRRHARR
jgi:Phage tail lysozyme